MASTTTETMVKMVETLPPELHERVLEHRKSGTYHYFREQTQAPRKNLIVLRLQPDFACGIFAGAAQSPS